MKIQALLLMAVTIGSVSSAMARSHDLVNQALDKTLSERARVERTYEEKVARPEADFRGEKRQRKIEVVMDGEIGGRGSRGLRDSDRSDRSFRERNVEAKLDREIRDIDRGFARADRMERQERLQREERVRSNGSFHRGSDNAD